MAAKIGPSLPGPELAWDAEGILRSRRFDDIYFSRADGVAEKRHVFLNGCGLPDGWHDRPYFTIGELGFGTGLNFLVTWDAWRKQRVPGMRLHYIAVEGFPLTPAQIEEAAAQWPELAPVATTLARAYPQPQRGFHRVSMRVDEHDAPIILTLLFGEVGEMLSALEAEVDAWYLDGFAPDKNPAIWQSDVFAELARLSHGGDTPTRLATYSVANAVRQGLEEAGFEMQHAPGFGAKRDMLQGWFRKRPENSSERLQPWFARPRVQPPVPGHVAVVGAGIAGASVCHALNTRGWRVTMIDRHGEAGVEASGNPVGVLMPRLTAGDSIEGGFHAAAWRFALNTFETLRDAEIDRHRCGVLQVAENDADAQRLRTIAARGVLPEPYLLSLDAAEATARAGCVTGAGLFFPQGGTVAPSLLCRALMGAAKIHRADVAGVRHTEEDVEIIDAQGTVILRADAVVFANALETATTSNAPWLPLSARRGQITFVPATTVSQELHVVLASDGYVTPAVRGSHCLGATFDWTNDIRFPQDVAAADNARNLAAIVALAPGLFSAVDIGSLEGRAALRCMTPDHLPIVGPLPDRDAYLVDYSNLRHGQHWVRSLDATYVPGVFVLTGLGARGLVTAPLAAEILACHITGEPWPIARELVTALHPARFLVRDLKRLRK